MISRILKVFIFISILSSFAWAQSERSTMMAPRISNMNVNDPVGWFPFLALSGGYITPNSSLRTEGTATEIKLMASYFTESRLSVVDLGLGFIGDSFTQKSATENNFLAGGVAEAAWRYNFVNRWQFGPIADVFLGGARRLGSTDNVASTFAGLQLVKEFPIKNSNMLRVGLKGIGSLSIPSAPVRLVMLDVQWGFGTEQNAPDVVKN